MRVRRVFVATILASMAPALGVAQSATATFAGVVTDSGSKPIAGAEVMLPDLGKGTATNEQGAFVLREVHAGVQRVQVRHVGYGLVESRLTFVDGETLQRHITMTRSTTLDSVVVSEKSVDQVLDDFEANRKLGLGHFLTRADLAPQEGRTTGAVLTSLPGIKVAVVGPYAWVGSGRHSFPGSSAGLEKIDMSKRAPLWSCYALIYMDNQIVWRGQKYREINGYTWEPLFDINTIPVDQIEAIEYYESAAQTPAKYATLNSECGVLVIHTLRFHPKDTTTAAPKPPPVDRSRQ